MKRVKAIHGYTIYEATSQRDTDNYGCEVGNYNIYISADIRDFGLQNSYPEYNNIDSLTEALNICCDSQFAIACALADELSDSTYQDMDFALEIERRLESGDAVNTIRRCYDRENGILYESISDAIDHGFDPYADDEFDPYEDHPAVAYDEAGKLHVVEDECEWDEDLRDGDLEDVFEAAILDAEVKDNPYAPYGGPDHLGETVREFIESSGAAVSTLDELNAALTECGCMPISLAEAKPTTRKEMRALRAGDKFTIWGRTYTALYDSHRSDDPDYKGYIVYDESYDSYFEDDFPEGND